MKLSSPPISMKFLILGILHTLLCILAIERKDESMQLQIFQSLYKQKRVEHIDAVKQIGKLDLSKQYQIIGAIFDKAFQVLEANQVKLREHGYVPGMDFPSEEGPREALSLCLENTAFLGEIVLRFPNHSHQLLATKKSWSLILTWGIFFASQSSFLDKKTQQLIYLVSQELELSERDQNYENPYAKKEEKFPSTTKASNKNKQKKKKSFKKGPSLSRNVGEL